MTSSQMLPTLGIYSGCATKAGDQSYRIYVTKVLAKIYEANTKS